MADSCVCIAGIILIFCGLATSKVFYNVTCGQDSMHVTLNLTSHPSSVVYLQNLKGYPGCLPEVTKELIYFRLSLNDSGAHCGVARMLNKQTGHSVFYHRVVIERTEGRRDRELLFVQCVIPGDFNMEFVRVDWIRESLPYNFTEPTTASPSAGDLIPYVHMAIRQRGQQLDTSTVVQPGSLLDLLVYLDKEAAAYYDISLRYLTLADASRNQEEISVMNGCAVDPYVFEVTPPSEGVLRSQFRAFKFQSSEVVLFLATVSVCLQRCVQVDCFPEGGRAGGEGGRRRREIPKFLPHYSNEAYEVTLAALLTFEPHTRGEVHFEDSTNDTLDTLYDMEYSGDFPEQTAAELATSFQPPVAHFLSSLLTIVCFSSCVLRNLLS